ncbi:MAG TPA: 23S rRNA (pseudouridine(1915)-N(3))-methyltransferase RlmH [Sphingobacteriaceae bacterium]|nr:23S rRNA (pseudouridine(1915)-N(3))-methyltransferase RlmH [Sphingobacteriaceae bacterium]
MKIHLICIGKTDEAYLNQGLEKYISRLKHYINFRFTILPDIKNSKNLSVPDQRLQEAKAILKQVLPGDTVVLLDEKGEQMRSVDFAEYLNKRALASVQQLVFVIGGPYGFDESLYLRAQKQLSLSKMTFSHQMVRLFFVEQLYRAFSIQRGEPYHHE